LRRNWGFVFVVLLTAWIIPSWDTRVYGLDDSVIWQQTGITFDQFDSGLESGHCYGDRLSEGDFKVFLQCIAMINEALSYLQKNLVIFPVAQASSYPNFILPIHQNPIQVFRGLGLYALDRGKEINLDRDQIEYVLLKEREKRIFFGLLRQHF
jgi:hypothetical protein